MKYYKTYLKTKTNLPIKYVNFYDYDNLFKSFSKNTRITFYDPVDHDTMNDIIRQCKTHNFEYNILDTKTFITPLNILKEYSDTHDKLIQYNFYKFQRQRLGIMMDKNKPIGNKWSFDKENRLPFPDNLESKIKDTPKEVKNKYITEAKAYTNKYFKNNPGSDFTWTVIDHKSANVLLNNFIKYKLLNFGPYQDAVGKNIFSGYHSVLSPLINVGLLEPAYIIKKIINNLDTKNKKLLISTEAYIRQLIGWREYCRLIYMFRHKETSANGSSTVLGNLEGNYFNNNSKLSKSWYTGKNEHEENLLTYTGFEHIDKLINKTWNYSYLHHIERLMFIGNFMLLANIKPNEAYKWFQTMFLDSYAVFMYPNVYGMSQYSNGPIMMTKPYFSSFNYIIKMSDFPKNNKMTLPELQNYNWTDIWSALYYSFINSNKNKLSKIYGTASQVAHWNNKSNKEKNILLNQSKKYKKILMNY